MTPLAPWGPPQAELDGTRVWLRTPLPSALPLSKPSALFVHGAVTAPAEIDSLTLAAGALEAAPLATAMPSPGLAAEVGPNGRRAIFWGVLALPAAAAGDRIAVALRVRAKGHAPVELRLGEVTAAPQAATAASAPAGATVAVCMATFEADPELLERQLDSLRAQTHREWVCLISDDGSGPAALAALERLTGDDPRFVVSPAGTRAGAYENFHRALAMAPAAIPYVALSDQDDEWYPDKLERLLAALGDGDLVFSDMRVVDRDRQLLAETYWTKRHPNHDNFGSLLLGNTVTGAASLFRRDLLERALPLPPRVGNHYHDHWLALVAGALGRIEYVPEPLYDYVQHSETVVGHAGANRGIVGGNLPRRLAALRGRPRGRLRGEWRRIYFAEYCRLRMVTRVLLDRHGPHLSGPQRRLLELIERGEGSPRFVAWLTLRQLRRLRRDDTLGAESGLLRGLAWSRALRHRRGADPLDDADLPPGVVGPEHAQPESVAATER